MRPLDHWGQGDRDCPAVWLCTPIAGLEWQCPASYLVRMTPMRTAVTNEADPFRELYGTNYPRVLRLLTRIVGPQEAEDLTQAVFVKAAKALPSFRGDAQGSTWLYRIAANTASDWLRSRPAHEAMVTVQLPEAGGDEVSAASSAYDDQTSPEQELARKEMHDCIRGEIGKLPEAHRTVLMLSALGGLTDEEIAQTLGVSQGNAKVRLHRARQEFKKIIEARCDYYQAELSCKPTSPDCCTSSGRPSSSRARH
jgi:RNA polymerase sigma-70 factor (ECF subfamily)